MSALSAGGLTPPRRLRLVIVDDHALVRGAYARLLSFEDDITVVGEAGDADAALATVQRLWPAVDLVLLDLSLPGRSGFDLLVRWAARWPELPVLVCSMHDSAQWVAKALDAGARGFVTKSSEPSWLPQAIRRAAAGEIVLSPDAQASLANPAAQPPQSLLSPREFEVLLLLARGAGVERVAQALHIAPKTAANLQASLRAKLGLGNAVELLHYARRHGLPVD
jgi:DNA-binding NarL/FixJ family response regulator